VPLAYSVYLVRWPLLRCLMMSSHISLGFFLIKLFNYINFNI
jgi:hypothetical protein